MAQIKVFQGGSIQPDAPQVTPYRAPDFGPGIGPGIAKLGESVGEAAQKVDEIQDVGARIEANKASIAYNDLASNIGNRVKSTLGDGAEAAAAQGVADLQKGGDEILSKASPRARAILAPMLQQREIDTREQFWTHGFEQKKQAYDTSSQAANDHDLDAALHQDTEASAKPYLDSIASRNHQRASFFGLGPDWETQENLKAVSGYHRGRAETMGATSAYEAVRYAIDNRGNMSDGDFSAVLKSFSREALHERAVSMYYGAPLGSDPSVAPPSSAAGQEAGTAAPTKTADPSMVFKALILPNEGSKLVQHDSNGAPVKYGINQKANPDVDVPNLTQAGAEKLFIDRTWKPSGADKLPPALAAIHADTYYLNPSEATKILKESGGDVQKYIELRNGFLAQLHASNPAKYPDYTSRNERVEQYAASLGGNGQGFGFQGKIGPDTAMAPVVSEIMQRTDIPLALKTELVDIAREDRNAQREDKSISEGNARDTLVTASTNLGDGFTSIKQLPPDALASASPEVISSLTDLAKTNRYKKDDESLRPYVTSIEVTDPQKFISPDFVTELMRKGASPSLIGQVQTQQADIAKKAMNAKPDVVASGALWSVAEPAFRAAGIGTAPTKTPQQKQQAAGVQEQAITYLHSEAAEWANAHPGQKASEDVMRQWVGAALLKTKSGSYAFQATDADIYNSIPDGVRSTIIRDLRRGGVTSQGNELVGDVASYYRKLRSNYGTGPIALSTHGGVRAPQMSGTQTTGFEDFLGNQ